MTPTRVQAHTRRTNYHKRVWSAQGKRWDGRGSFFEWGECIIPKSVSGSCETNKENGMERNLTERTCDQCGKVVIRDPDEWGGEAFKDWIVVLTNKVCGDAPFDFCCVAHLTEYYTKGPKQCKTEPPKLPL